MASRLAVSMARVANTSSVQRLTVRTVASRSLPCLGEHTGTVKWYRVDKGFGFILDKDGQEYFVHYSTIKSDGFKSLGQGEMVEFDLEMDLDIGQLGKMKAVNVTRSTHTGTVKWYTPVKGYGFILDKDGQEYFVPYSEIKSDGLKSLRDGESVRFDLVIDPKKGNIGKMRAVNVTRSNGAPAKGAPPFKPRGSS